MANTANRRDRTKVKNIILSGTNFWNPGDDFVRDGVIQILKRLFKGYTLNFLFYNFNQDFFPQSKFSGITNTVAKGDLDKYSEHVDAIVVAGLSAGGEITDLYHWIIDNNLHDRVYLIGAGYENAYVDRYISQEPAATIFKNARIITGRTRNKPQFISDNHLSYHHINCPAILSVPTVKDITHGKQIEKIAFSIQLPHQLGIMNQSCSDSMHKLAMNILFKLYPEYEITVIAHHKTEYFYFLELFQKVGLSVPVLCSSFYQDLFDVYPQHDLVISTRLHACLFGNGYGIPAIIINDTDRHTHTVDGFPHSLWVDSLDRFDSTLKEIKTWDLSEVAEEAEKFKGMLLSEYQQVLAGPFGVSIPNNVTSGKSEADFYPSPHPEPGRRDSDVYCAGEVKTVSDEYGSAGDDSPAKDLAGRITDTISKDLDTKRRVLNIFQRLTKDYWLQKNIEGYRRVIQAEEACFDAASFLNWYAEHFKPRYYLEVGVRRGRSLAQVMCQSPETIVFGFDIWIRDYGSKPELGINTGNPGPQFVLEEMHNLGNAGLPTLVKGNSHQTLPQFWSDKKNPQHVDLIFVDGDHTYAGAKQDLDICFHHLADGGALVFDDIVHPSHPELKRLWEETKIRYPDFLYIEHSSGMGTGVAFKPPFDNLKHFLSPGNCSLSAPQPGETGNIVVVDKSKNADLPVHFFTIVLNGEPFIRHHIEVFKQVPFKWHWHIVEGVAALKHDTAWSLAFGGRITDTLHSDGLSNDGTKKYLDELVKQFPENITLYRKPRGVFWDGKLEMVNAPLENVNEECLLWQVDADELWTKDQLIVARQMFKENPGKTAAYYYCHYFVGENLVTTTRNTYGNNTGYEWLRTWRFKPGMRWAAHEPPRLCRRLQSGEWEDIVKTALFTHGETETRGLVFQHYAYATEKQLRFKETYFGYKDAVKQWRLLQKNQKFPILLRDYFAWVTDTSQVGTIGGSNFEPIARRTEDGEWIFLTDDRGSDGVRPHTCVAASSVKNILWVRTDSIGDNILAASMLPHIRNTYENAQITVVCQEHIEEIYEACPFVDDRITFDRRRALQDEEYRSSIIRRLQALHADIALNPVYSREPLTDIFAIESGARERIAFNGDLCNISAEIRDTHNQFYTRLVPTSGEHKPELERHGDFLKGLGIDVPSLQPIIWTTTDDEKFADDFFTSNNLQPEKTIALFSGAQAQVRIYSKYGRALSRICHENGFTVLACGSAIEHAVNQDNLDAIGEHTINLCGRTTVRQTAALLKRCRLAVGAETGTAHLACAVGTQNVILLGGGHFGRFMPYSPLTSMVCLPLECYGCNWQCRYPTAHCIKDVAPEVLTEAVRQTLERSSEGPRVFVQGSSLWNRQAGQPKWQACDSLVTVDSAEIIPIGEIPSASSENQHGEDLFSRGDTDGALQAFTKAIEIHPDLAIAHNNLGVVYWQTGEVQQALDHFIRALEIDPNDRDTILNCGELFSSVGKGEDARTVYASYLQKNPDDEEIAEALTGLQDKRGVEKSDEGREYLVSAIVSTYNSERFIRGCLEDLEAQTIADRLEIVVVNSGSEENEEAIVGEFQKKYSNIRYIRTDQRETVYAAWNRGVRASSGKYITNANTDDRRRADACERMAEVLEGRPDIALVYADVMITEGENETCDRCTPTGSCRWLDWDRTHLLEKGCFIGPQPMWRRTLHDEYGYFDDTLVTSGDYEFWLRVSQTNAFLHISDMLGLYLNSPDSIEHSNRPRQATENERIVSMYRKAAAEGSIIRRFYSDDGTDLLRVHNRKAEELFQAGDIEGARGILEEISSRDPRLVEPLNNLGVIAFHQGETDKAASFFARVLERDENYFEAIENLGKCAEVRKDYLKAAQWFERGLRVKPEEVSLLNSLGNCFIQMEDLERARDAYERSLGLDDRQENIRAILRELEGLGEAKRGDSSDADRSRQRSGAYAAKGMTAMETMGK